jgi:hypothetical protein
MLHNNPSLSSIINISIAFIKAEAKGLKTLALALALALLPLS